MGERGEQSVSVSRKREHCMTVSRPTPVSSGQPSWQRWTPVTSQAEDQTGLSLKDPSPLVGNHPLHGRDCVQGRTQRSACCLPAKPLAHTAPTCELGNAPNNGASTIHV